MSQATDLNDVIDRALEQGWRHQRTERGHHQFYAPNGKDIVVTGGTPSDGRAWDNFMADMKRAGFVNGVHTLGDALSIAVTQQQPKPPNGGAKLSVAQYVIDFLARHPEGMDVDDINSYVRSVRPDVKNASAGAQEAANLTLQGKLQRVAIGRYRLAPVERPVAASTNPAARRPNPAPLAAGCRTGDAAVDDDLTVLDNALSALAALEGVVRRNREVLMQFAQLKKLLGMKEGS